MAFWPYPAGRGNMNTLIQQLCWEEKDGNSLYIKREDLLPFSMGGNKVRIAEALFQDMQEKDCDSMIIYGSVHSNLCRVLSAMCYHRSMECTMICSHEEGENSEETNNEKLIQWTGTPIVHCTKNEIAQTVDSVMEQIRKRGKRPYYIYGSRLGTGNEGTLAGAYADAYKEITAFEGQAGWEFDYVFCPSGTGATQAGLICGHLLAGDHKKVMGVMISSRETERAYRVIADSVRAYFEKQQQPLSENFAQEICLLDQYRQEGYGKYDKRITDCLKEVYLKNGIPMDPVYTAKAFWGMREYIREKKIENSRILFLHTGGTPLFYDFMAEQKEQEGTEKA